MQKRLSLRRVALTLFAAVAASLLGGASAHADGEFCLVPPTGQVQGSPFAHSIWGSLHEQVQTSSHALPQQIIQEEFPPSSTGVVNAMVILVDFQDTQATRPNLEMRKLFFGDEREAPYGSVAQYFKENSYGKSIYRGTIFGNPTPAPDDDPDPNQRAKWLRMPQNYSWYANNNYGFGPPPQNVERLVQDALRAVLRAYPSFDFSIFDGNNDGFVDLLYIVHAGPGAEGTADPSQIWSHRSTIEDFVIAPTSGAGTPLKVRSYAMGAEDSGVGVHAHESLHVFGLPDLYTNPQGLSVGLGDWSMMASGSNIPSPGYRSGSNVIPSSLAFLRPAHLDAWSKIQLGWISPTVITRNVKDLVLPPVQTHPVALKIPANANNPREYFLIENRPRLEGTYDAPVTVQVPNADGEVTEFTIGGLHGSGVLIYHVDERRGSNDDRGHLMVMLEEANEREIDPLTGRPKGMNLLLPADHPSANPGEEGDPFGNRYKVFSHQTTPSSVNYEGKDSGVRVYDITAATENGGVVPRSAANATLSITVASIQGSLFTANGQRLPQYTVRVLRPSGEAIVDPQLEVDGGEYIFSDLEPGSYLIELVSEGYIPQVIPVEKGAGPVLLRNFIIPQPAAGTTAQGWNMVSFPMEFNNVRVQEVIGGEDRVIYGWDGTNYIPNPVVQAGQAYWIFQRENEPFAINVPGLIISPEEDFVVPVKRGWNLIGNPFPAAITWSPSVFRLRTSDGSELSLDAAANAGLASATAWSFNASDNAYDRIQRGDPLLTYQGFWYKSEVEGELVIPAPFPPAR